MEKFWVIKTFVNHYWNKDLGWIAHADRATKYDTPEDAEIELAINPNIKMHSNNIYRIEKIFVK
jgi:hypothetical protein